MSIFNPFNRKPNIEVEQLRSIVEKLLHEVADLQAEIRELRHDISHVEEDQVETTDLVDELLDRLEDIDYDELSDRVAEKLNKIRKERVRG